MGYALTTAWDEGQGCVAAAAAGADSADPAHDDDSRPHSSTAQQAAQGTSSVRALQVCVWRGKLCSGDSPGVAAKALLVV